jgi:hypothetical protein
MFWRSKGKPRERNAANVRLAKKILGKDPGRRTFGFPCSPNLQASMKSLADQMHVPLYALAEHSLQLGAIQIEAAMNDPEERELLRRHLMEVHVEMRTIEKVSNYDEEASETLSRERIRRFGIDNAARKLVVDFLGRGVKPEEIDEFISFGRRCMLAIKRGWPCPPEVFPGGYTRRPQNPIKKTTPDESENNPPDRTN